MQQGKAQQAQYNYQAEVARNNAKIAQANADQQRQEGIEESRLQRIKTLQAIGKQQTRYGSKWYRYFFRYSLRYHCKIPLQWVNLMH